MTGGSEERKRQLAFEFQNSRVFENRSNSPQDGHLSVSLMQMILDSKVSIFEKVDNRRLEKYLS